MTDDAACVEILDRVSRVRRVTSYSVDRGTLFEEYILAKQVGTFNSTSFAHGIGIFNPIVAVAGVYFCVSYLSLIECHKLKSWNVSRQPCERIVFFTYFYYFNAVT